MWTSYSEEDQARYLKETEDEAYSGKPTIVTDYFIFEIRGDNRAAFCIEHIGHLMHGCSLAGIAKKDGAAYVFKDAENPGCILKITRGEANTTFEDVDSRCRQAPHCGARAFFDDAEFTQADKVTEAGAVREAEASCKLPD